MGKTTIAFTGDIAFSKYFSTKTDDDNLISKPVVDFLRNSDYCVCNIEGPQTARMGSLTKDIVHANNPDGIKWINKIKGNIWCLANNHTLDSGREGLQDTFAVAEKYGVKTVGAGYDVDKASEPVFLKEAGGIGIIAVAYPSSERATETDSGCFIWDEDDRIKARIAEIRKNNRWCIVIAHGGDEFSYVPMPTIRRRYMNYLEWGADIVVGHHPHVVQNYERLCDKIIFYSLGNFIFDTDYQRYQAETDRGVLLKLIFDDKAFSFETIATRIDRNNNSEHIDLFETPVWFTEISANEYEKIWPLSAAATFKTLYRKRDFIAHNLFSDCNSDEKWLARLKNDPEAAGAPGKEDTIRGFELYDKAKYGKTPVEQFLLKIAALPFKGNLESQ